ncbi:MAG: hypothetical protein DCC65_08965 [Planctomycetota bacterium]|nr:MAG: hypothetical protein DCC65_08965 [Planctomycetota bacterium]
MEQWLITGAGGQFGSVLLRRLTDSGVPATGLASPTGPSPDSGAVWRVDLADPAGLSVAVRHLAPRFIIHAGAVTSIQAAHDAPDYTRRVNIDATRTLVETARAIGAKLVLTSTDLVFDGTRAPYAEDSLPSPLSVYARSKVEAERIVLGFDHGIVVRLALMYGRPAAQRNTTFLTQLSALRTDAPLRLFADEFRTPIWLEDAATATLMIAESDITGVIHLGGPERMSRLDMGRVMARALGVSGAGIVAANQREMASPEPRPPDVSLVSARFERIFGRPPGRPMQQAMELLVTAERAP